MANHSMYEMSIPERIEALNTLITGMKRENNEVDRKAIAENDADIENLMDVVESLSNMLLDVYKVDVSRGTHELHCMDMITFKREKEGKWEIGFRFNEGEIILDKRGQSPVEIWDYKSLPHMFSMSIDGLIENAEEIYCPEEYEVKLKRKQERRAEMQKMLAEKPIKSVKCVK